MVDHKINSIVVNATISVCDYNVIITRSINVCCARDICVVPCPVFTCHCVECNRTVYTNSSILTKVYDRELIYYKIDCIVVYTSISVCDYYVIIPRSINVCCARNVGVVPSPVCTSNCVECNRTVNTNSGILTKVYNRELVYYKVDCIVIDTIVSICHYDIVITCSVNINKSSNICIIPYPASTRKCIECNCTVYTNCSIDPEVYDWELVDHKINSIVTYATVRSCYNNAVITSGINGSFASIISITPCPTYSSHSIENYSTIGTNSSVVTKFNDWSG